MSVIEQLEQQQVEKLTENRKLPEFGAGDTLRVNVKVVEGSRERVQAFEGVCIGRKNAGLNSSFTVRKLSYGEGVERVFPLYSPRIESVEVLRRGRVRRAKLYYLRGRTGKAARIAEKTQFGKVGKKGVPATAAEAFESEEAIAEAQVPQAAPEQAKEAAPAKDEAKSKEKGKAKAKPADKKDADA